MILNGVDGLSGPPGRSSPGGGPGFWDRGGKLLWSFVGGPTSEGRVEVGMSGREITEVGRMGMRGLESWKVGGWGRGGAGEQERALC